MTEDRIRDRTTAIARHLNGIAAMDREAAKFLHLTANESLLSRTARRGLTLPLADHYFMGGGDDLGIVDFRPFTFRGLPAVGDLVDAASDALRTLLHAADVNLKCLSGVHTMMCAILSLTEPGDGVMTVDIGHGGHFATPVIVQRTGRRHLSTRYRLDDLRFDAERIAEDFHRAGAKALYLDVSYYLNPHNLRQIRAALGDEAVIIYDASHTLGLIMGGLFQAPLTEGADVLVGNTHKTLPGPQKGLIAFRDPEMAQRATTIINNGLVSSVHTGSMVALAITILEMEAYGRAYARQIVANSNALGAALEDEGWTLRRANTGRVSENHQVHLLMGDQGERYRTLYAGLVDNLISLNFDSTLGAGVYARLGTQRITRAGMGPDEMRQVGALLSRALRGDDVRCRVAELNAGFPRVAYSFDDLAEVQGWLG
nr:serine hydroxymethyltransferase [Dactylosporangium thailandense]